METKSQDKSKRLIRLFIIGIVVLAVIIASAVFIASRAAKRESDKQTTTTATSVGPVDADKVKSDLADLDTSVKKAGDDLGSAKTLSNGSKLNKLGEDK